MYTITNHNDIVDKVKRRRIIDVTFTKGDESFLQSFQFSVNTDLETIKKTINDYLTELNLEIDEIDDFVPAPPVPPTPPTAKELAKQDFDASVEEYKHIKEMNAILPAIYSQWMLDNQVVICQQKYQTWQNTPA
jgi:hypothetical protein